MSSFLPLTWLSCVKRRGQSRRVPQVIAGSLCVRDFSHLLSLQLPDVTCGRAGAVQRPFGVELRFLSNPKCLQEPEARTC